MNRREAMSALFRIVLGAAGYVATSRIPAGGSEPARARRMLCRPLISGPLWWFDAVEASTWGVSGWRDELDVQRRIGFDLLWLTGAPYALDKAGDPLGKLMDLCARRKVQVILDTGTAPGVWYQDLDPKKEIAACKEHIRRIAERFRGHPAFYAWYIPHEIYMSWGPEADKMEQIYCGLAELCKKACDIPVTLSPFFILDRTKVFGDFRYNEPDEYREYWAKMISKSGIDVIMLQDSGEHFSYVTNEQRRPFFAAMQSACREGRAKLWGNVETAEYVCPSIEEYVRRYGRVHHSAAKGLPWRPVPIDRLKEKLELAAEYCERIVTWGYREFCRPSLGEEARKWYADYRAYVQEMNKSGI